MPPSPVLQALLIALDNAMQGSSLVIDARTLGGTGGAPLLQLLSQQLATTSLTLDNAVLPAQVTGDMLPVTGDRHGVAAAIAFQDVGGEVAVQALFQAPTAAPILALFPVLPAGYFSQIAIAGGTATVTVPGLGTPLALGSFQLAVTGLAMPAAGIVTTSIAPRVEGSASPPSGARGLLVELATPTSGYRIAPTGGGWAFPDLGWMLPGLDLLAAFPSIIPTADLGLGTFDLNLYPDAPDFSSISLDVADIGDPTKPLWSAVDGKVQLTDVIVTLGLSYSPTLVISLSGTGSVQGNFVLGTIRLQAQIPFPLSGVWAITAYPHLSLSVLNDLAVLLPGGASQLDSLMPAGLSALGNFELSYLRIAVDASAFALVDFTFVVGSTATWPLVPDAIELAGLSMSLSVTTVPTTAMTGRVVGTLALPGGSLIVVNFGRTAASLPWRLDVTSPAIALPSLGDLTQLAQGTDLGALVQAGGLDKLRFVMTDLNVGLQFGPTELTNLGLTLQLANAATPTRPELDWELIPGVLTLTRFAFGFQLDWGASSSRTAFGEFVLNGLRFAIRFASQTRQGASTNALIAEYSAEGDAGTVDVKQLIMSISPSVAEHLPDGLEIDLADAMLAYLESGGVKKYLFAMDIAVELPLSDLPLVGKALPADARVGLKHLKVVVTSAPMTAADVAFINSLAAAPVLPLPQGGTQTQGPVIPSGFSMVAELQLGALSILLTSPPAQPQGPPTALAAPAAAPTDPVMWIQIQKTFGPVAIQKIGFAYEDGALFALSNLAITVGTLEIDLIGIGVGSPIDHPEPRFTIQGLGVSLTAGPVSVRGGMVGTLQPLDFVGAMSVQAPELALAAFAGYAEYLDHPSFFLYGVLDVPIGGPPPFFVTGVAAGLGFNRKLVIPDVSRVANFPLVAWAQGIGTPSMDPDKPIGDQVGAVLAALAQSGVVAPSVGDYWLAAGIQFTSFELVKSFALLTVGLGTDVEIALLGLSTLSMPPDVAEPVAQVQLALEVSFSYSKGLLAVAGQLTPNSYVLSRSARLTGGFAFDLWFRGDHAGEVVLSLGGYNPNFSVPGYYPVVPRVGLTWQVVPELSITGGLYFALTSNAVMAGGKLGAVWRSGPISAWFTYWADFLMTFLPFHYYVDGGIDLGASFTIHRKLFSLSMTIHVGVNLALWGPPFAGRAVVDLSIISFTIEFGDPAKRTGTSIPWPQFVEQLLPAQPASSSRATRGTSRALATRAPATAAPAAAAPAAVVQINVTAGLTRTLVTDPANPWLLVDAETVEVAVITVIPSKKIALDEDPDRPGFHNLAWAPQQPARDGTAITPNTAFGCGPANLSPQAFQPGLTLSLASQEDSVFHATQRFARAPRALWQNQTFNAHGVPKIDPKTGLVDTTIPDTLAGVTLTPYLDRPAHTTPVPLSSLLYTLDGVQPFAWSPGVPPTSDPFTDQTVAGTIATPVVTAVRTTLLEALAGQSVTVDAVVNIAELANPGGDDLEAAPRLRLLGQQAAAPGSLS